MTPNKRLVSNDYVQSFIERLNVETILQKSRFREKDFREIDREKIQSYYKKILKEKYNWDVVIKKYESLLH